MSEFELLSPLSPVECAARLRETTDRDGLSGWFGSNPVVGRVSDRFVRLRKRIDYRNPFQPFLIGSLEESEGGTWFRGTAGIPISIVTLLWVVLFPVAGVSGVMLVFAVQNLVAGVGEPANAGSALLMLAFVVGVMSSARWLARGEERFLVTYVAKVIEARER